MSTYGKLLIAIILSSLLGLVLFWGGIQFAARSISTQTTDIESIQQLTSFLNLMAVFACGLTVVFSVWGVLRVVEKRLTRFRRVFEKVIKSEAPENISVGIEWGEWRLLNDSLLHLNQTLAQVQSQQERQQRMVALGDLTAGIAHEVGNPVAAVSGYLEMMRDNKIPSEDQADILARCLSELNRIKQLLKELQGFASTHVANSTIENVGDLVAQAGKLMQSDSRFQNIKMEFKNLDFNVRVEQTKFHQVLINLLVNSADAISGIGTITIERIHQNGPSESREQQNSIEIIYSDTGPGIPRALHSEIFKPFFTTKAAMGGTGLGLALCHNLLHAMAGRLTVLESKTGARFSLTLPVA